MIDAGTIDEARRVDLATTVRERGIRLSGRSPELCGPCPLCGGHDRFSVNLKKQVFNCRGCGTNGAGSIDLVMFLDGCDLGRAVEALTGKQPNQKKRAVCQPAPTKPTFSNHNSDRARWLWSDRRPITEGCPVDLYLRGARSYDGPIPATLGYLPANGEHPPAMIAAFGFCEEPEPGVIAPPADVMGIHITRLTPEGRKASIEPVKIMFGPSMGLPIVLAPANDLLAIDIIEGIEKGLLVQAGTGAGMWVAGSAGRMPAVAAVLPGYVEFVTIWADQDEAGVKFAQEAARIIQEKKVGVRIKRVHYG